MHCRLLILGLLLAAAGCPSGTPPAADLGPPDLTPMCTNAATLSVGDACTPATACQCTYGDVAKNVACIKSLDVVTNDPNNPVSISLPGNYCSSKNGGCDVGKSDRCGDSGGCVNLGSGNVCLEKCTKGHCRTGYSCITVPTDVTDSTNATTTNVCLTTDPALTDCNPAADPTTQCTQINGQTVANMTNGNPNGGCLRIGPDDVGLCELTPCNIGPGNCPGMGFGCMPIDPGTQIRGGKAGDKGKNTYCFPISSNPPKTLGQACMYLNDCADNLICNSGTCRQQCFKGTVPTYTGQGNAMYKNAALMCPAGTVCTDVFTFAGIVPGYAAGVFPGVCK